MEIFGKDSGSLLAVFEGSDLDSVNRSLGQMPEMMKEFAGELDYAGDLLGRLPNKSDQFFAGFTAGVVGNIIPSLEMIDGFDFTNLGKSLGDSLSKGIVTASQFLATLTNSFTQMGSGETPIDAFQRFQAEQDALNREDAAAAEERKRLAAADAAYQKARTSEHRDAPFFIDPSTAFAAQAAVSQRISQSSRAPEFDDYQRRGLSLSASPQAQEGKKMLTVMEQVRNILNDIKNSDKELAY